MYLLCVCSCGGVLEYPSFSSQELLPVTFLLKVIFTAPWSFALQMHATLPVWILSVILCVAQGHGDHGGGSLKEQPDNITHSVSQLTEANTEFAFRLYRSLAAQPDSRGTNIFFSPLSVSLALAALAVGARGETHRQLLSGLGFSNVSLSQTDVDQAFQSLFEGTGKTSNQVTSEGTAVFMDQLFKPRPEFLDTLKKSYFADGFAVDFTKSSESANTINKYVEEKTSGKIDRLVEDLDPSTVMYLISYFYFKGKHLHLMRSRCVSSAFTSDFSHQAEAFIRTQKKPTIISELWLEVYSPKIPVQGQVATISTGQWTEGGGINRREGERR